MPIVDPLWPRADTWLARGDADPDLTVVGVPTSSASLSPSEAWRAPAEFRAALARFSTFDGESLVDLRDLSVSDAGDLPVAGLDMNAAADVTRRSIEGLDASGVVAIIGGDNAITRSALKGLAGDGLSEVGLLTLDAHHDVRLTDDGPSNGSPVRGLIEDGLPGRNVVQVGIHSFANSGEYRAWCDDQGIEVVTMDTVDEVGAGWVVASALRDLAERTRWIYVDCDVDVLDISAAPGCPGSRPGGMTPRQLAAAMREAGRSPHVQAVDLVEVDPTRDPGGATIMQMVNAFLSFASGLAERVRR